MLALHRAHDGLLSIGPNVPNLRVRLECAQSGLGAGAVFHALLYEFGLLLAFLFFFGGFALSFLLELLGRLGIRGLGWRIGRCFFGGFFLAVFRQLGLGQRIGRDRAGYTGAL